MKLQALSFLVVRVLSLYMFILGLSQLVSMLTFTFPTYKGLLPDITYIEVALMVGIPSFVLILSSIVLWLLARKFSTYLVPKDASDSSSTFQSKDIEGFVFSVIGLILLVLSGSSLVRMIMNYIHLVTQDIEFNNRENIYSFVEQGIRFLIGIVLLLKAEGFALFLRKIRNLGLTTSTKNT